jgi:hypothetical protein
MRIGAFIFLFLVALFAPLPVFLVGVFFYVFVWEGYELLFIGVVIDSVYGTSIFSCLYTALTGALLLVSVLVRPYVSWYTTDV